MMKQAIWAGLLILVSLGAAGCTNTLVFAEKDGYNLAINVNDDPSTPVHVNIGLERRVAAVVPPLDVTKNDQGQTAASAEAVSLFSGYRLKYYNEQELARTPFSATLAIRTQFASGMAARKISRNPEMVGKVVNVDFIRDAQFRDLYTAALAINDRLLVLTPAQALALAKAMEPFLQTRSKTLQDKVQENDPARARLVDGTKAKIILLYWQPIDERTPTTVKQWTDALDVAERPS